MSVKLLEIKKKPTIPYFGSINEAPSVVMDSQTHTQPTVVIIPPAHVWQRVNNCM